MILQHIFAVQNVQLCPKQKVIQSNMGYAMLVKEQLHALTVLAHLTLKKAYCGTQNCTNQNKRHATIFVNNKRGTQVLSLGASFII